MDGFGNHKLCSSRPQLALQSHSAGDSCSSRIRPSASRSCRPAPRYRAVSRDPKPTFPYRVDRPHQADADRADRVHQPAASTRAAASRSAPGYEAPSTPLYGTAAVRRSPAVRATTSAFPRFRRLHPQQQTFGQVAWRSVPDPEPTSSDGSPSGASGQQERMIQGLAANVVDRSD